MRHEFCKLGIETFSRYLKLLFLLCYLTVLLIFLAKSSRCDCCGGSCSPFHPGKHSWSRIAGGKEESDRRFVNSQKIYFTIRLIESALGPRIACVPTNTSFASKNEALPSSPKMTEEATEEVRVKLSKLEGGAPFHRRYMRCFFMK